MSNEIKVTDSITYEVKNEFLIFLFKRIDNNLMINALKNNFSLKLEKHIKKLNITHSKFDYKLTKSMIKHDLYAYEKQYEENIDDYINKINEIIELLEYYAAKDIDTEFLSPKLKLIYSLVINRNDNELFMEFISKVDIDEIIRLLMNLKAFEKYKVEEDKTKKVVNYSDDYTIPEKLKNAIKNVE